MGNEKLLLESFDHSINQRDIVKWFSIECQKTKAITLNNHKRSRQLSEPIRI